MLVSIIINNYNYARYVGTAIGSALAQTWHPLEVIVVDDGSTDESWSVIQGFGDSVRAIQQDNGGQGAAYNTGFAASRGEWVLFLDSDDALDAGAVARMMALAGPHVAKVHGSLRRVDADGKPIGGAVPYITHDGDVRPIVQRFCQYGSPPSSGNLFRRSAIAPYFPMQAANWRRSADTVPILLSTFHGDVATVPGTIGCYRLHQTASRSSGLLGNKDRALGPALAQTQRRRDLVAAWGTRCTGIEWTQAPLMLPWDWRLRALSWRLARSEHPYPHDTRRTIWRGLNEALAHWPGYTALERQVQRAWVAFALGAPLPLVAALAPSNLSGRLRRALKGVRKAYP
jgi:glycosyltransferase involved in cell wall biosynthesis